jgi:hypothetical protein
MTRSNANKTTAPSTTSFLRPSTLALAAVIALEVLGMRALPSAAGGLDTLAVADGAPAPTQTASVDVRIVAQADLPAR